MLNPGLTFCTISGVPKSLPPCRRKPHGEPSNLDSLTLISCAISLRPELRSTVCIGANRYQPLPAITIISNSETSSQLRRASQYLKRNRDARIAPPAGIATDEPVSRGFTSQVTSRKRGVAFSPSGTSRARTFLKNAQTGVKV